MRSFAIGLGVALLSGSGPAADPPPDTKPRWLYGHDLRVRRADEVAFGRNTPQVGVEFYHTGDAVLAVTQRGSIAAAPVYEPHPEKGAVWMFGHDLRARAGNETQFADARKFGVEAYKDNPSRHLLLVSSAEAVALAVYRGEPKPGHEPAWHHALTLRVRAPGSTSFDKARPVGVEAFRDENVGGLLYLSESGFLATAPAPKASPDPDRPKNPVALYGLELQVRQAGEPSFTADTRKIAVEVFRDENAGGLLYVSDTGAVAAAPAPADLPDGRPTWMHGMVLRARPGGNSDFGKANRVGVEVYRDGRTGYRVFVSDTGSIAVLP